MWPGARRRRRAKQRGGLRLAAELLGVALLIAIVLEGGVLLTLYLVAHPHLRRSDPVTAVNRDAGYRLDPPGAHAVNDVEQGCDSTQLMMSRQFNLHAAPAQVFRYYERRLPELGWKEVPAVDGPGTSRSTSRAEPSAST